MTRSFAAKQATLDEVPFLVGIIGPPGGGKTWSALRLATGMQRVRPGPIILIDTERGRASKYAKDFDFLRVEFNPPFVPADFLQAIKDQLSLNPAAIIVDSLSDEHEGEGGVLDWHDQMVPKMGGNEWAAWSKPKASRRTMINGFLQIKTPLIFTFRAREKTKQMKNDRGRDAPVNIGYQPIAPTEIIYALDLTCILPPKAEGVPIWKSEKAGEDFIIKLPNYLKPFVTDGKPLSEEMGAAFAAWAKGGSAAPVHQPAGAAENFKTTDVIPTAADYHAQWAKHILNATSAKSLGERWANEKEMRRQIEWTEEHALNPLKRSVEIALESLRAPA